MSFPLITALLTACGGTKEEPASASELKFNPKDLEVKLDAKGVPSSARNTENPVKDGKEYNPVNVSNMAEREILEGYDRYHTYTPSGLANSKYGLTSLELHDYHYYHLLQERQWSATTTPPPPPYTPPYTPPTPDGDPDWEDNTQPPVNTTTPPTPDADPDWQGKLDMPTSATAIPVGSPIFIQRGDDVYIRIGDTEIVTTMATLDETRRDRGSITADFSVSENGQTTTCHMALTRSLSLYDTRNSWVFDSSTGVLDAYKDTLTCDADWAESKTVNDTKGKPQQVSRGREHIEGLSQLINGVPVSSQAAGNARWR